MGVDEFMRQIIGMLASIDTKLDRIANALTLIAIFEYSKHRTIAVEIAEAADKMLERLIE
jgi:hypothetical protein